VIAVFTVTDTVEVAPATAVGATEILNPAPTLNPDPIVNDIVYLFWYNNIFIIFFNKIYIIISTKKHLAVLS
jgi:hypothetical protein